MPGVPDRKPRPAELMLTGPDGAGFLMIPLPEGDCVVKVDKRYVRMLIVLAEAEQADRELPPAARGWRRASTLCRLMIERFRDAYLECPSTIRRYAWDLKKALSKAAGRKLADSELPIQTERNCGLRLWLRGLVIKMPADEEADE